MPSKNPGTGKEHKTVLHEIFDITTKPFISIGKKLMDMSEWVIDNFESPLEVPAKNLEGAMKTRRAVSDALNKLKYDSSSLEKKGIHLKSVDYYTAIAFKESHFKPFAISNLSKGETAQNVFEKRAGETTAAYNKRINVHAYGAFQLKPEAIKDVNRIFGSSYKLEDVYYVAKETDNPIDSQIEETKVQKAMETGALISILYWHYCRDIAPKAGMGMYHAKMDFASPADKDRFAAFCYNYGSSRAGTLVQAVKTYYAYKESDPKKIKAPKTFEEFAKIAAMIIAEDIGGIKIPEEPHDEVEKKAYYLNFESFFTNAQRVKVYKKCKEYKSKNIVTKLEVYRPTKPKKHQRMNYNPHAVLAGLDYAGIIDSIRRGKYFAKTETVLLADAQKEEE